MLEMRKKIPIYLNTKMICFLQCNVDIIEKFI